ncbi:OsmC family protein [Pontibacter oryzae]|uniref:OsmC family peroxiredoxin n=1 Tax=Pontibacter oryzae TaxID=2304593 RepID=A0A399SCV6_9BACT|nr:OsmC family protein [Pontibacter oryzae]RIJ41906.1 OsmC family peroxiredoxin [Pontibacter oryzae]
MSLTEVEGFVTVSAESTAPMVAKIQAGTDVMTIDESGIAQGIKAGADPYDYILGALGSCTVITLHMYAQRKGWPLELAEVKLRHERIHADDCGNCEDQDARLSHVTKKLRLVGELSPEQLKRLKAISEKCPVQKTLQAGMKVSTELLS